MTLSTSDLLRAAQACGPSGTLFSRNELARMLAIQAGTTDPYVFGTLELPLKTAIEYGLITRGETARSGDSCVYRLTNDAWECGATADCSTAMPDDDPLPSIPWGRVAVIGVLILALVFFFPVLH